MLIEIAEARKIMGAANEKYSDTQIQEILDLFYALSNLSIDRYLEVKKPDRKDIQL